MADKPVRWGHIFELDQRCKPGTAAWYARHPEQRLKLLSAWRYLHRLSSHPTVSGNAPIAPSSNMNLKTMLSQIRKTEDS